MDRCTNKSMLLKFFLILNSSRIHKILNLFSHTFIFRSHFSYLFEQLPDTCGMEKANANVKSVEIMLLKEVKHCVRLRTKTLLQLLPFASNTIAKLKIETLVSQALDNFYPLLARFWLFKQFPVGVHQTKGIYLKQKNTFKYKHFEVKLHGGLQGRAIL